MLNRETGLLLSIHAEEYVKRYLQDRLPTNRYFHGVAHTAGVAEKCITLSAFYRIGQPDTEALLLAAWFHDIGYCHASAGHEEVSISILKTFFSEYTISKDFSALVESLIKATVITYEPQTLLEKVIRDADSSHLASPDYLVWSKLLKQEIELCDGKIFTHVEWNEKNITFFESHRFYTDYAIGQWNEPKDINLKKIKTISLSPGL